MRRLWLVEHVDGYGWRIVKGGCYRNGQLEWLDEVHRKLGCGLRYWKTRRGAALWAALHHAGLTDDPSRVVRKIWSPPKIERGDYVAHATSTCHWR